MSALPLHVVRDIASVGQLTDTLLVMDHGPDLLEKLLLLRLLGLDRATLVRVEVGNHLNNTLPDNWANGRSVNKRAMVRGRGADGQLLITDVDLGMHLCGVGL